MGLQMKITNSVPCLTVLVLLYRYFILEHSKLYLGEMKSISGTFLEKRFWLFSHADKPPASLCVQEEESHRDSVRTNSIKSAKH